MQGAEALDSIEGDVSAYVDACTGGYRFVQHGLGACFVDTSAPGNRTIDFFVRDSASQALVTATRTLAVLPRCFAGEVPCSGGTCSFAGICLVGFPITPPVNQAPKLSLLPGDGTNVYVPRGQRYQACTNTLVALGRQCERGVSAQDAEDGDLQQSVLACPAATCIAFGCPGQGFNSIGAPEHYWGIAYA